MDSLTQIVLGGAVGEAVAGKKIGNKAVLWGAIAGTIPDLDVFSSLFMDTVGKLHFHRGPTHSILFSVVMAPILGYLVHRMYKKSEISRQRWSLLFFLSLVTHPILDCFTTWGTEIFWPFWGERVAFNSIFVVDPLYTLPFLLLLVAAMFFRREKRTRRVLNWAGIIISTIYLGVTVVNKFRAIDRFEAKLAQSDVKWDRLRSSPTPFNSLFWHCEAQNDTSIWVGYHSLRAEPDKMSFKIFSSDQQFPPHLANNPRIQTLLDITKGWYLIEPDSTGYWVRDLRFGRNGFEFAANEGFVFNYFVPATYGDDTTKITESRRMPPLTKDNLNDYWNRIMGR